MTEKKGRIRNVKRNIVFALVQVTVSQILPFVVRTILIYRLGVDYLGLNSLFASILSVLSLMELGFGTAVVYSLYRPVAEENVPQICAYLSYYRRIYRFVGLVVLGIGLAILPFLRQLIHDPTLPGNLNIYVCYLIFLGDAVISYLLFGYMAAIPIACQRRDILSRIDTGMLCLKYALQALFLLNSKNFYFYLFAMPAVTITRNLVMASVVKKRYPDLKCKGDISREQKKDMSKKVAGLLINKLTTVSRNSIDSICISAFIGLAVTGKYNNYYFVIKALLSFSGVVCSSMMASVGNSISTESREKNYSDFRLFDFIYMAIAGWATCCMLCLYQPFIITWLGRDMTLDIPVVIGLSLYYYILKSGDIRWIYHEGAGLWYECRFIMLGETAANVILNIFLCHFFGVFGIVLATVISVFFTNFILCPKMIFRLYFKQDVTDYWKDHMLYTVTMVVTAGMSYGICEAILPGAGIAVLIGRLIICSLVSAAVFMLIWCRSVRYKTAAEWLKKMMRV